MISSKFSLIAVCLLLFFSFSVVAAQSINGSSQGERELGEKLYREGRYSEAVTTLKKAVKQDKTDADAWYFLGLSQLRKRDFKAASKAFENTLKLKPTSAAGHAGLGYSYFLRNKLLDSIRECERAISIDDGSTDAHFVLGMTKLHLGSREDALREAEKVIKLDKKFAEAYLLKSQALVQFSRDILMQDLGSAKDRYNSYGEAAAALATYLKLAPNSADNQLWSDQLAALNFHLAVRSKEERQQNGVYTGREVTTKARLINKPEPAYTENARKNGVTGTVILRCLFAADGTVKHIVVIAGLPDGLTWLAVRAAKQIKFLPAALNGQPVGMIMQLEYNFYLY